MRGERAHSVLSLVLSLRFIPACAGNARRSISAFHSPSVHPRVRGERDILHAVDVDLDGSSPRARGTRSGRSSDAPRGRFIPACAGNAPATRVGGCETPVHPRVRGERFSPCADRMASAGSSPRARGTQPDPNAERYTDRFIPACAGNAQSCVHSRTWRSVHPRVRGERLAVRLSESATVGSSPRARGTRVLVVHPHGGFRFIPACAGNA